MQYTETELFFLHFFLADMTKKINLRFHSWDAFDLSKSVLGTLFELGRGNVEFHTGDVGYFKDETKCDPIVFIRLRLKMYWFIVCDASEPILRVYYPMNVWHKAVATRVARFLIRSFKHKEYVHIYNGGSLINVLNCRIGS